MVIPDQGRRYVATSQGPGIVLRDSTPPHQVSVLVLNHEE